DVRKHLDERVLDSLVGLGSVAKVLIRDSGRAPLMDRDELSEPLARLVHFPALDQPANLDCEPRICRERRSGRWHTAAACSGPLFGGRLGSGNVDRRWLMLATH